MLKNAQFCGYFEGPSAIFTMTLPVQDRPTTDCPSIRSLWYGHFAEPTRTTPLTPSFPNQKCCKYLADWLPLDLRGRTVGRLRQASLADSQRTIMSAHFNTSTPNAGITRINHPFSWELLIPTIYGDFLGDGWWLLYPTWSKLWCRTVQSASVIHKALLLGSEHSWSLGVGHEVPLGAGCLVREPTEHGREWWLDLYGVSQFHEWYE